MKYITFSIIFALSILNYFLMPNTVSPAITVSGSLIIIIFILLKERFFNNIYFSFLTYLIISGYSFIYPVFSLLLGIIVFDIFYNKYKYYFIVFSILPLYLIVKEVNITLLCLYLLSAMSGYILGEKRKQANHYLEILDNERRLRYELEAVKQQLINNNKDIERLTEIKERNRIARDIHDNIGHDITGVLFQLQAAHKLYNKDSEKANNILSLCIDKLSNSLEMIRDTVHNIKPAIEVNKQMFNDLVEKFIYCPIDFKLEGDVNSVSSQIIDVLYLNMKESLTNATKYSGATKITIAIEIQKNYVRFFYQDNGNGCGEIVEGLGISGMKERVKNVNGNINITSEKGFSIVCVIPLTNTNIFKE